MILIALDIDGTLASAGGPVTGEAIREKLYRDNIAWGIVSSRSVERSREACDALGVTPAFIKVCRVEQRAEELREVAEEYLAEKKIYVADRGIDKLEAERAGWSFSYAAEFAARGKLW